ncbi:hypothetical protein A33Q_0891 [Indibacter alkaliphilus LW1]|uniref:Uncharacterized protein n=1 Tax=Indibacter alkaliphilus (strain CCUG 57479 / KCTC 22604 / LW1) TaxID=1189612 RepID=S2E9C6_INDAL|nr:hypothetical protein A33Q_0891 [Indibacter alkaliphilus LW1]
MTVGVRHPDPELAEVKACPAELRGIYLLPKEGDSSLHSE